MVKYLYIMSSPDMKLCKWNKCPSCIPNIYRMIKHHGHTSNLFLSISSPFDTWNRSMCLDTINFFKIMCTNIPYLNQNFKFSPPIPAVAADYWIDVTRIILSLPPVANLCFSLTSGCQSSVYTLPLWANICLTQVVGLR